MIKRKAICRLIFFYTFIHIIIYMDGTKIPPPKATVFIVTKCLIGSLPLKTTREIMTLHV